MEASVEDQQILATDESASAQAHHFNGKRFGVPFTKENSAEMARRATAARKLREKAEAEESARRAAVGGLTEAEYVMRRITRTREQIEELDRKMSRSSDPRAIKALSDAMKNLAELERVLSGRPLPGSNKPSSPPRKAGSNGQISPLD